MENNNFKPFPFDQLKQKKEPEKTAGEAITSFGFWGYFYFTNFLQFLQNHRCYTIMNYIIHQLVRKEMKVMLKNEIIEKAKESQVPTYKDNKLASTLSKLQIGDMIPPELYEVVAEILVFVDDMDRMKAKIDQAGVK